MKSILITDRYAPEAIQHLKQSLIKISTSDAPFEVIQTALKPEAIPLSQATALLIRSRTVIDEKLLNQAQNLRVVITATSGYDHIDLEAAKKHDVKVMYTPDANAESAAEHTLLLMLSTLRRMGDCYRTLRDGRWKDDLKIGNELQGQTVGLIGLGRVGSRVAALVQAFGAHVLAHDPFQKDEVFEHLKIERMGLTEVFAQADILSLHVPLTAVTRRLIRSETLELTQDGLILINTSRGKVVDESALVTALESGEIAAAGLDVFEHEPLSRDSRLRKMPNVVLSPHIGAFTEEAFARGSALAVEKLLTFLKSGETSDEISDNLPLQPVP